MWPKFYDGKTLGELKALMPHNWIPINANGIKFISNPNVPNCKIKTNCFETPG